MKLNTNNMKAELIIIIALLILFLVMGFKYYYLKLEHKQTKWYMNFYHDKFKYLKDEKARRN